METLFAYRDWTASNVPDFDNPGNYTATSMSRGPHGICPEPSCLKDDYSYEHYAGPIVFHNADGEPSGVARPCAEHQDFDYAPGWYLRFSEAVTHYRQGGNKSRTCSQCGQEFTQWLWGWGSHQCAECAYRAATGQVPPAERRIAVFS